MEINKNHSNEEFDKKPESTITPPSPSSPNSANGNQNNTVNVESSEWNYTNLSQLIPIVLNPMGRYQIALLFALTFISAIVGINHTLTSFHIFTPSFYCEDYKNTTGCDFDGDCTSGFVFDDEDHTIVSEWSLVCSRRLLAPMVNTLYFCGVTVGALVCGLMADKWGRKKIIFICLHFQGLFGLLLQATHHFELFVVLRTLQGFFVQGLQGCTYTLLQEYVPPRFRTLAGVTWELNWAIGLGILGGTSYAVRNWRMLQILLTIPTGITLLFIWGIPESIYWLYATNKHEAALKLCIKTAKANGNYKEINELQSIDLAEIKTASSKPLNQPEQEDISTRTIYQQIFATSCLRKHLFVMTLVFYGVTLSYYGILYFLPNLAGNRHLNFGISAGIEVFAYVIAYFILTKWGRRIPMATFQIVNGCIVIIIGLLVVLMPEESHTKDVIVTVLSLSAKGMAVASFCGMFIYTSELFPTICRGAAIGFCGLWARIGSLMAPFLMILEEYTSPLLPMAIMGVILIITGVATFYLPETLNQYLPNTVFEAREKWQKKKESIVD